MFTTAALSHWMRCLTIVIAIGWAGCTAAHGSAQIDALVGQTRLERLGEQPPMEVGTPILERDMLEAGKGSALRLSFASGVYVELGDGRLALEKLPGPESGADRNAILSLMHGDLHLSWQPAEDDPSAHWRLVVYFGNQHAVLIPGDYYFSATPSSQLACAASGRLQVISTSARVRTAATRRCYSVQAGQPGRVDPVEARTWAPVVAAVKILEPIAQPTPPALPAQGARDAPAPITAPLVPAAKQRPVPLPDAAAPMARPPPETAAPRRWALNLATLDNPDAARKLSLQVLQGGYPAITQIATIDGKTVYRVQVTGFVSADAARALEPELAAKFPVSNMWPTLKAP